MNANQARDVFIELVAHVPPESWEARLAELVQNDEDLRQRVTLLLAAHSRDDSFLESPAPGLATTLDERPRESPGAVIGPYKLLEQIGEGGFGVVFMAEQTQPVRRMVALKILKPGMDTRHVIARFEAERQVLAIMDHPNIAKVHDAGCTASGRPYFVMELVKGVPITEFADQHHLTLRQRLELFVSICQAIQHAHQKGIIHRDLKPSNVLVSMHDATPMVKVIDFGVAKALGQELTDKTLFTGIAQMIGTPLYMSPEQAGQSGLDIDTRSDIYSLGVLLYELLTGMTPFDKERFKEAPYDEMLRIIREEEPPRPSTRLSTTQELPSIAANRGLEPKKLSGLLRGELDWIVMTCLDKDRNRRYDSANGLARDIDRYLHDEPVLACPPSAIYRMRKWSQRHKSVVRAGCLVAFLTVIGLVTGILFVKQEQAHTAYVREQAAADLVATQDKARRKLETHLHYQNIALVERARASGHVRLAEQLLGACDEERQGWEWHYLKGLRYGSPPPLRHGKHLFSQAFSPDGRLLAVGDSAGIVTIWDARAWRVLARIKAHNSWARSLAFSPNSQRLASAGWDRQVKVWDVASGQPIWERALDSQADTVAFSADGSRVASASHTGAVVIWNAEDGQEQFRWSAHHQQIFCVAFSPDGKRFATASIDRTVKVWDSATWTLRHALPEHVTQVLSLAFSPDSQWLASASGDFYMKEHRGELKLWDMSTGHLKHTFCGPHSSVFSVAFSPDGRCIASGGGEDPTVKIWDVASGLEALTLRGHADAIWGLAFHPGGFLLASASGDQTVRLWDATPLKRKPRIELDILEGFAGGSVSVAFNPRSQAQPGNEHMAAASQDGVITVWDAKRRQVVHKLHEAGISQVIYSPDGSLFAAATTRGLIQIWDATTWKARYTFPNEEVVLNLAFSSDSKRLAATAGKSVKVWDLTTGAALSPPRRQSNFVISVAFSPDGRWLACSDYGGNVTIVASQAEPGNEPRTFAAHAGRASCLAFSPDGRRLVSAGMDGFFNIWDTTTWELIARRPGHAGHVHRVAFSPDGSHFVSAGSDATIRMWETTSGKLVLTNRGHTDTVHDVSWSRDGLLFASASLDGTVRIWDANPPPDSPARTALEPGR